MAAIADGSPMAQKSTNLSLGWLGKIGIVLA
jgi:hypothetical protein